jgi:hypothetical protein
MSKSKLASKQREKARVGKQGAGGRKVSAVRKRTRRA